MAAVETKSATNTGTTVTRRVLSFDVGIRTLSVIGWEQRCHIVDPTSKTGGVTDQQAWADLDIVYWDCIDILQDNGCRAKNAKTVPAPKCTRFIVQSLWQRRHGLFRDPPDAILIEQQPLQKSGQRVGSAKNKIIANAVLAFVESWIVTGQTPVLPHPVMFSARSKLRVQTQKFWIPTKTRRTAEEKALEATYKLRKQRGVELATQVLDLVRADVKAEWADHLFDADKQDDLSDCMLQGLFWLQSEPLIRRPKRQPRNPK